MNQLSLSLQGNLDPETYQKEYDKALEDIGKTTSGILTNKIAASNFGFFRNSREPFWQKNVNGMMKARVKDNAEAELFEQLALVEDTGSLGTFPDKLAAYVSNGVIDKSEGIKLLIRAKGLAKDKQEDIRYRYKCFPSGCPSAICV